MTTLDIAYQRLHNHRIASALCEKPEDVVQWLCAVQSQDYAAAKWAVGQRTNGLDDASIEKAFNDGAILRTHVMRPTWHFVMPADIRWMLKLTALRVNMALSYYNRKVELDDATFARTNNIIIKALEGGKHLMRPELDSALKQAGINTDDPLRLNHIIMRAELDAVICSGTRRGKQQTYALLDERVPKTRNLERDEALAELARRYFVSHGPATLKDYVWWSGLTMTDAKAGIEMTKDHLQQETIDGQTYWFAESKTVAKADQPAVYLLPNFDEYIVGYTDRSAIYDNAHTEKLDERGNVLFSHTIVINGRIVGTWKRTVKKSSVVFESLLFVPLSSAENEAIIAAAERFGKFLDLPVVFA
jgi:hypothetical protein